MIARTVDRDTLYNLRSFFFIRYLFLLAVFASYFLIPSILKTFNAPFGAVYLFFAFLIGLALFTLLSHIAIPFIPPVILVPFIYFQLAVDEFAWVFFGLFSGWPKSPYLYFLLITIMFGAVLLKRQGAIFSVVWAVLLIHVQGILIKSGIFISRDLFVLPVDESWYSIYSRLLLYTIIFSVTAYFSYKIVRKIARATGAVKRQQQIVEELKTNAFSIFTSLSTGFVLADNAGSVLLASPYAQDNSDTTELLTVMDDKAERVWHEVAVGKHFYHAARMPWPDNQYILLFSDITKLKRREEREKLKDKLASIGGLTATIAHEIKNPLASLIGASELLFSLYPEDDPQAKELVEIITREGTRVKKLLDDLFLFTEQRTYCFKQVCLADLIDDITVLLSHQYPQITVTVHGKGGEILCDVDKMKEALWNVVINACEAMGESGTLDISTKTDAVMCSITIADSGGGIPEKHIKQIFDPFFSTKKRGTGIGLALVYQTIQAHRGKVSVKNGDKGAVFTISVPVNGVGGAVLAEENYTV